jgi:cytochrome c-type biogenesis protein
MIGHIGLALIAGVLSTLSPCVLPLVPIVLSTAASEHRFGPGLLAVGVATSFTAIGLFVAMIGFSVGLDGEAFRIAAAAVLLCLGVVLIVPSLQARFAVAAAPIANWADLQFSGFAPTGLCGQFGVGLLLGALWSPCVGPTLGSASILAAQRQDLADVALTMAFFGFGTALPLLVVGALSREALRRWRGQMIRVGGAFKIALGFALVATASGVLLGLDRTIETALVNGSPIWLTSLTTRF